jgi:hypothetical protein
VLQRRAVVVAIGVEADTRCLAEFDGLVENNPLPDVARAGAHAASAESA